MVFISSRDQIWPIPPEKVFDYQEEHVNNSSIMHPGQKNLKWERTNENTYVITRDTSEVPGLMVRSKTRVTLFRPFCLLVEFVEGDMTGSVHVHYMIRKGNKTLIRSVGEWKSRSALKTPKEIEKAAEAFIWNQYKEDMAYLKTVIGKYST